MQHKRRVKLGISIGVIILFILLMAYIYSRLNSPHEGVVIYKSSTTPTSTFDMTPKLANGTYASFNYPTGMEITRNNPIVKPVVEQFNYLHRDIESWNLAVAIMNNPGGSVSTNNTYQYRKTKPAIYNESDTTINSMPVVIMTDTSSGGFSKVAILQHGAMGATISLYGDDSSGTKYLQETFNLVLSTWKWN